jgi:nucleoside 2-deoxyribosyltransferase
VSSFYFAARFSRRFELQGYRRDLRMIGHEVTARWIDSRDDDDGEMAAARDIADIELADGLISFAEAPRSVATRGGRHVELGVALALGKRVIAVGHRENVFFHLSEVEFFESWPDAIESLKG